jgi:anti-sigma factor RsiW
MSNAYDHDPTDEELVAYLDGELEPAARVRLAQRIAADHELQRRLIVLSSGNRPFRQAFDFVLDAAPRERLDAMLAGLPLPQSPAAEGRPPSRSWSIGLRAVAASLLLFLAGLGTGWLLPTVAPHLVGQPASVSENEEWRQAIAEYLILYTAETLASIPDNAAVREQEIAAVGAKIGMALSPERISLPGLSFKRAQLLEYDRRPLGQLAYLDPASGPVALCLIMDDSPDASPRTEQRQGFNIVYWSRGRRSFMLLGRMPIVRLQTLASDLSDRLI